MHLVDFNLSLVALRVLKWIREVQFLNEEPSIFLLQIFLLHKL
jgi:hypothetical protein